MKRVLMFFVYFFALFGFVMFCYLVYCVPIFGFHGDSVDVSGDYEIAKHQFVKWESGHGTADILVPADVIRYNEFDDYFTVQSVPEHYSVNQKYCYTDSDKVQFCKMMKIHDCYWIVKKTNNSVVGPLTYKDFVKKCDSLGIEHTMHCLY